MNWRSIVCEFGNFELDRPDGVLRHRGVPVDDDRLDAQALDFLALLLSRNGLPVTYGEIIAELWPTGLTRGSGRGRRRPDAENVHRVKRDVVQILDRFEFDDSWIQARYAIGYVVNFPPPATPPRRRVAVLPFVVDGTGDASATAHDLLIALVTRAARAPLLAPLATSAVLGLHRSGRMPNEIARAVQADFLIAGSVSVSGAEISCEAELLGRTGRIVERIETRATSIDQISVEVIGRVERIVTASDALDDDGPGDRDVAERFALAADYYRQRDFVGLATAHRLLERIVEDDAAFLAGRVLLADVTALLGSVGFMELEPIAAFARARELVETVIAVDPDNSDAIATAGLIDFVHAWDFDAAELRFEQAQRIDPDSDKPRHWHAHLLLVTGRTAAALAEIDAAKIAAPTNPIVYSSVGWLRLLAGRVQEAVEWGASATSLFEDFSPGRVMFGQALECAARYGEAEAEFVAARDIALGPPRQSMGHALTPLAALGHLYATTRRAPLAREILESFASISEDQLVSSYCRALVLTGLGDTDGALDALEAAVAERCDWLVHLDVDPRWRPLKRRKRFRRILELVGLSRTR